MPWFGEEGPQGPPGVAGAPGAAPADLTPAEIAAVMYGLNVANVQRQTGLMITWGCRFASSTNRSCAGVDAFWKSAGAPETLNFALWNDAGAMLATATATTSTSTIVSPAWDAPVPIEAKRLYTVSVYVPSVYVTTSYNVLGYRSGERLSGGLLLSSVWYALAANAYPLVENSNSPPTKSTVCPRFA